MQRRTETFRRQHKEILETATLIAGMLSTDATIAEKATQLQSQLARLSGQLTVHLSMEDKGLYPRLLGHKDKQVRELTTRYQTEMGGLKATFTQYVRKWSTATSISKGATDFGNETRHLLDILGKRIAHEDSELYVLVDQHD